MEQKSLSDILDSQETAENKLPAHRKGERFLKGPIPWRWIVKAANLPGGAIKVGLAVWFQGGMKRSRKVKLSNQMVKELGISRQGKYSAIENLERAGLVTSKKKRGRATEVTILDVK